MSVASSFSCIKIPSPTTIPSSTSPCSSSSTTSTSSCFIRFTSTSKKPHNIVIVRNSQAEGPLRRPVAPPPQIKEPSNSLPTPSPPLKPVPPSPPPPPPSSPVTPPLKPAASQVILDDKSVVTMEFQRQKAKELQDYFKQKKAEEANQGPFFGFIGKNEIANGRWAMFGFAVGLLTEYATGSDFVDQVKILLSNFGIIDLE